ncbi:MAG: hypothetical protein HXY29_10695 [Rhodocyclaceae bacterium]|jgi:multidrug resistance efflux pump|nr:hypothetical protein [Rhodocyclaceae bacterium]
MRILLILINVALLIAIVFVVFFWEPQFKEAPLPGTHDARLGGDVPAAGAVDAPPRKGESP